MSFRPNTRPNAAPQHDVPRPNDGMATSVRGIVLAICSSLILLSPSLWADFPVFRATITNTTDESASPDALHLILFDGADVYDFSLRPPYTVTVIQSDNERIVMLANEEQVQCKLSTSDLMNQAVRVKESATTPELKERWGISAVAESSDDKTYELAYGAFHYQTTTQPAHSRAVAVEFARFADWACRLNILRKLGPPPFGRMTLNEQIAAADQLPQSVTLTYKSDSGEQTFHSTYEFTLDLTDADKRRIESVQEKINTYREVPLKAFP
ncbi:hypothetical protein [Stieleria varia]|uniref:DUF4412 domain-containing protein n=1 Tax=Stieleria varia TaxID=2528005 RepID=A0A5C6A632_9BACT|nr:hypothetical protein [Stieleria varia]TWT93803.1 hypothetical protein Pla52n_56310 [Stieleria varia]